jgi:threonine-phosphate decarboxylase
LPVKREHGGNPDPKILDFSANVNPLGPPKAVLDLFGRGADFLGKYPSLDAGEFCAAAASHHRIPRECVLAGNGSTDLIYLLTRLFEGQRVRVVVPAFTEYEDACEAAGIAVNEGEPDVTFLANPTSPEGRLIPRDEILGHPGRLVVDEAFMDFVGEEESLVGRAAEDSRLIVMRTLTKFYAIPGLRLGYLVAAPGTVSRLRRWQPPWSVNALAISAGIVSLADWEYAERTRLKVNGLREDLIKGLAESNLEPMPSLTNFILCRVPDAEFLCRELLARGIAARNCDSFTNLEMNRYVRFAVRAGDDNCRLIQAVMEIREKCPALL